MAASFAFSSSSESSSSDGEVVLKTPEKDRTPKYTQPELDFSKPWKMTDLVLSVERKKLHVHKSILTISSPVFEAMLSSNFKEKNAKEIPLPGKTAEEIVDLLRVLYPFCGDAVITSKNCFSLLELACEYQMEQVKERCEKFLFDIYGPKAKNRSAATVCEEALQFVVMAQSYQLDEEVVQCCISAFVSQRAFWETLKTNKVFSQLDSQNRQRVMEERVKFLEKRMHTCYCKPKFFPSSSTGSRKRKR